MSTAIKAAAEAWLEWYRARGEAAESSPRHAADAACALVDAAERWEEAWAACTAEEALSAETAVAAAEYARALLLVDRLRVDGQGRSAVDAIERDAEHRLRAAVRRQTS